MIHFLTDVLTVVCVGFQCFLFGGFILSLFNLVRLPGSRGRRY